MSENFGVEIKRVEHMGSAHNFSQIYANSLVDVGQPVERLSPWLICRATSPIYASGACSKLAGVFTARRFTGTPGWKRSRNVCRATDKTTRLHSRVHAFQPPRLTPVSHGQKVRYMIRALYGQFNFSPKSSATPQTDVFRTLGIFLNQRVE